MLQAQKWEVISKLITSFIRDFKALSQHNDEWPEVQAAILFRRVLRLHHPNGLHRVEYA